MVEGDLDLISRAGAAALKGAVLAIVIGALIGLLRLDMNPIPSEILSRTRPSLLDLGRCPGLRGSRSLRDQQA